MDSTFLGSVQCEIERELGGLWIISTLAGASDISAVLQRLVLLGRNVYQYSSRGYLCKSVAAKRQSCGTLQVNKVYGIGFCELSFH